MKETVEGLNRYCMDINGYPLLTRAEEDDLSRKVMSGDDDAFERLVNCNLRLVVKIAHDFKNKGVPLEDIIAEGNTGLIKAARKYDCTKGAKFSTYASFWIKQAIRRYIGNTVRVVRVPLQTRAHFGQLSERRRMFAEKHGRAPTRDETIRIAKEMGFDRKIVARYDMGIPPEVSLQENLKGETDAKYEDLIAGGGDMESMIMREEELGLLPSMLGRLDYRSRTILEKRFGFDGNGGKTLDDIALSFKCTRERVRQIEVESLQKLKRMYLETEMA